MAMRFFVLFGMKWKRDRVACATICGFLLVLMVYFNHLTRSELDYEFAQLEDDDPNKHRHNMVDEQQGVVFLVDSAATNKEAIWGEDVAVHDQYSILINTFRDRDDDVAELIQAYVQCPHVDRVVVLWNDFQRKVPDRIAKLANGNENVRIDVQKSTKLTNRFLPTNSVRTLAIFSTDEDLKYSCNALTAAWEIWRRDWNNMVGFAPRRLSLIPFKRYFWSTPYLSYDYYYEGAYENKDYNTLWATKGAFLHRRFFEHFWDPRFKSIRKRVDAHITAEDFLMSFVHRYFAGPRKCFAVVLPQTSVAEFPTPKGGLQHKTQYYRPIIAAMIYKTLDDLKAGDNIKNPALPSQIDTWCDLDLKCMPGLWDPNIHVKV